MKKKIGELQKPFYEVRNWELQLSYEYFTYPLHKLGRSNRKGGKQEKLVIILQVAQGSFQDSHNLLARDVERTCLPLQL
jgi:hypothetical protein